jgi:hypothetical protein
VLDPEKVAAALALAKDAVIAQIKAKRDDVRFNGGVKVGVYWFLSTLQATTEYTTLLNLATIGNIGQDEVLRAKWRTMEDGVDVDMTPALVPQILQAGFFKVAANDDVAEAHIAAVRALDNEDAVKAYDFSGNWPEVYGEAA